MPEINSIKYLRNNNSLSVNEIVKIHNINWSTAKKYADNDQISQEPNRKRTGMMYEEQWGQIVSDWLMEDYALKKKSQRNNTILFNQLKAFGFPGSYRTVCNFIADWKKVKLDETDEVKEGVERLTHPPAEAQVDFELTEVVQDGEFKDIHCLVMSLPYSNGGFVVPMPAENQEWFLEGLKILISQVGFVPRKLRLDNLSAAVVKARGNGKGHVGNKIGYTRYQFFVPAPVIHDLEHLTKLLLEHFRKIIKESTIAKKNIL